MDTISYLKHMIDKGGPTLNEYGEFDVFIASLKEMPEKYRDKVEELQLILKQSSNVDSIQQHVLKTPYGYKGDFEAIDKIYMQHVSSHERGRNWDRYFHHQSAAMAVRNRKEYFKKLMKTYLRKSPVALLNVASGPARDVLELYHEVEPYRIRTTCLDADHRAISYAKGLCSAYLKHITFITGNALKFQPKNQYDVIWSAGLFDYFNDRLFVFMLKRMRNWLHEGGEIVVGNFGLYNPSRTYMEVFGEWFLEHRSAETLRGLAAEAGYGLKQIAIDSEPLGINLFLRIRL